MTLTTAMPPATLLAGLFDDAALFPPASTPMTAAVAAHRHWRSGPLAGLVGPFVCSLDRWPALAGEGGDFPVSLTVPGPGDVAAAVATAGPRLAMLEVGSGEVAEVEAVRGVVPAEVPVHLEVPVAEVDDEVCRRLETAGLRLKLRTGGTTAAAFPDETDLGHALAAAVRTGVPTKLTAGLHHAVRHRDPATGFEHHGFLNVMLAVHLAATGGSEPAVVTALDIRDEDAITERLRVLDEAASAAVRRTFRSFGTCSIAEPVADLRALGLLADHHGPR